MHLIIFKTHHFLLQISLSNRPNKVTMYLILANLDLELETIYIWNLDSFISIHLGQYIPLFIPATCSGGVKSEQMYNFLCFQNSIEENYKLQSKDVLSELFCQHKRKSNLQSRAEILGSIVSIYANQDHYPHYTICLAVNLHFVPPPPHPGES